MKGIIRGFEFGLGALTAKDLYPLIKSGLGIAVIFALIFILPISIASFGLLYMYYSV